MADEKQFVSQHSFPPDAPLLCPEQLALIYAQARREYPKECCGYILESIDQRPGQVIPCTNRQDQLHAYDPKLHPRDATRAYSIEGAELLRLARSFDAPPRAVIIYHSHPDVGAYFSDEDVRAADAAGYPVDYLVVDTQATGVLEAKLFRRSARGYEEVARFPGDNAVESTSQ